MKIQISRSNRGHSLESQWQQEIIFWLFCLVVSLAIILAALETVHAETLGIQAAASTVLAPTRTPPTLAAYSTPARATIGRG